MPLRLPKSKTAFWLRFPAEHFVSKMLLRSRALLKQAFRRRVIGLRGGSCPLALPRCSVIRADSLREGQAPPLQLRNYTITILYRFSSVLGVDDVAPVQIASAQSLHQHLRRGGVGGKGDLIAVAQALDLGDILKASGVIRIAEE